MDWEPSLWSVIIKGDSTPNSQVLGEGRTLISVGALTPVVKLPPIMKIQKAFFSFEYVQPISKCRWSIISPPQLLKLSSPLFQQSWAQTEFWPQSPIAVALNKVSLAYLMMYNTIFVSTSLFHCMFIVVPFLPVPEFFISQKSLLCSNIIVKSKWPKQVRVCILTYSKVQKRSGIQLDPTV